MLSSTSSKSSKRAVATRLDVVPRVLSKEDLAELKMRPAEERDYEHAVYPGTEIWLDGKLAVGFYRLEEDTCDLLAMVKRLPFARDFRTTGMRSQSCIFGYRPRETLRKNFCSAASMVRSFPQGFAMLDKWASIVERYYAEANPELHTEHTAWADENVEPAWRMTDSIFTSGIVNKNAAHHYHKDFGNVPGMWNAMIVLSHDIEGGDTVVPELRTAFRYDGRPAILVFPAEATWHAVKPTKPRGTQGYRYSLVFYSLAQMCQCLTRKGELVRVRKVRTEQEHRRADLDSTVARLEETGGSAHRKVINGLRENGKLADIKRDRTLEERIARLKSAKSTRAKQVLRRLEKKLKEKNDAE